MSGKEPSSEIKQWLVILPMSALVLAFALPFYFFADIDLYFYRKLEISVYLLIAAIAFGAGRLLQLIWKNRSKDY